jgi:hypothetical protein
MKKEMPAELGRYLDSRYQSVLGGEGQRKLTLRGFWVGCSLSFFLAIGAPYGNMIIRGSYMALDFNTPGAIFLFLLLIGVLNLLFKVAGRSRERALALALIAVVGWLYSYWPFETFDLYSPGLFFSTFLLLSFVVNLPVVWSGRDLVLDRAELILVYAMLLIVSALCTMGLGEQILPMITAIFYFASPENKWAEKLLPHFPEHSIMVEDGSGSRLFYEGLSGVGQSIPYGDWVEPLMWWAIFLLALYMAMVSIVVVLRRQWMEKERLAYPITQVALAMVRGEEKNGLVNGFFKQGSMWVGCAIPMVLGSLIALNRYDASVPTLPLSWSLSLLEHQELQLHISHATLGFSYFINANIAAGIWIFHILSKFEKELFILIGLKSEQKIAFGVGDFPFLGYQGVGALIGMVVVGLWIARDHIKNVFLKAVGRAPHINDGDEIISYRSAVLGTVGGILVMAGWLWVMGTPLWIALLFVVLAMLIFIGITRIVTEAGLVAVRAPMIAPELVVQGLGSVLVGPTGVINLSLAYIWAADVRVFVMGTCANALKLIDEMDLRSRKVVFWAIILALLIGALGSFWMIFHMAYRHGGINLNGWFFEGAPKTAYESAARNLEAAQGIYWPGLGFFCGGGVLMALMMFARQRFSWWPVHPIGFPIGANSMMNHVWFSVFLAWSIKKVVLRYGGAALYQRSQAFFMGLIVGQVLCNGIWLVIDYFTGKVGNSIYWV